MKMNKALSLIFVLTVGLIAGCRDEAKNPTLEPEFGAYAKGQFLDASNNAIPTTFGAYSQTAVNAAVFWDKTNTNEVTSTTKVNGQVFWNAGKESVVINNIELYVQYIESYADKNNNVLARAHGPSSTPTVPEGKLWKTIPAAARFTPSTFTITPADVYNLYKGTTFDYKGTGAVDIFEANPCTSRVTGSNRFAASGRTDLSGSGKALSADQIVIRWRLVASDGRFFGSWHNNVCTQLTDANCSVLFIVK